VTGAREASARFACFGSACSVLVIGDGEWGSPGQAVARARELLLAAHERFTRFDAASELSRLNADPRAEVPAGPLMLRLAAAVGTAGRRTGGLVDATLLAPLRDAGYEADLPASLPLADALARAGERRPAAPSAAARWREIAVDADHATVRRPPGVAIDSGGLVKGLLADVLADALAGHASFAVDCAGDLRVGGSAGMEREVRVADPFGGEVRHAYALRRAGVATSGIGRRSWLDAAGRPAHHLLDPATGRPAYTGVVQATALAPTALEAEWRAKAAVLSGPGAAAGWLPHGGVVVVDDGSHFVVPDSQPALRFSSGRFQPAGRS
jgi:thiamine biosynthesis lipoprotein